MGDIYQDIWNADQAANGLEPILDSETGDPARGFVKVNAALVRGADPDLRVMPEAVIPAAKRRTYELCKRLFDNYNLPEQELELTTPEERQEVHDLVEAMLDTPPMEVARAYVARETDSVVSRERWHTTLIEMWFRQFSQGGDPALSGFEHVVVGEQEGSKVQGHHFWYKYFLDDGFAREVDGSLPQFQGLRDDRIEYLGSRQADGQIRFPESVTISFRWHAPDFDDQAVRPLTKPIGGFFVGCSVEGLLALGTVRAHRGIRAPKIAVIEGARYDLRVFHSPNQQHVRTFFPVFKGAADPVDGGGRGGGPVVPAPLPELAAGVRIVAAMINPPGDDVGSETVTLVNTSAAPRTITNWSIVDRNGAAFVLPATTLEPGQFFTARLTGQDAQLSNKGGRIRLLDGSEALQHEVTYSKAQARAQGQTVLF